MEASILNKTYHLRYYVTAKNGLLQVFDILKTKNAQYYDFGCEKEHNCSRF